MMWPFKKKPKPILDHTDGMDVRGMDQDEIRMHVAMETMRRGETVVANIGDDDILRFDPRTKELRP